MREKIDFYQQGLLDDDSPARVQDLLTGYTSRIPYVGGLLSDVIDPREVQAADLDREAAFAAQDRLEKERRKNEILRKGYAKAQEYLDFNRERALDYILNEDPHQQFGNSGVDAFYEKYGSDPNYVDPEDNYPTPEGEVIYNQMIEEAGERERQEFINDYPKTIIESLDDLETLDDPAIQMRAFEAILDELDIDYEDHVANTGTGYLKVYEGIDEDDESIFKVIRFGDHGSSPFNTKPDFDISPGMHGFQQILKRYLKD